MPPPCLLAVSAEITSKGSAEVNHQGIKLGNSARGDWRNAETGVDMFILPERSFLQGRTRNDFFSPPRCCVAPLPSSCFQRQPTQKTHSHYLLRHWLFIKMPTDRLLYSNHQYWYRTVPRRRMSEEVPEIRYLLLLAAGSAQQWGVRRYRKSGTSSF